MKYVRFEKAFTVALPLELYNDCNAVAIEMHVPMAEVLRIALTNHLKTKKKGKTNVK